MKEEQPEEKRSLSQKGRSRGATPQNRLLFLFLGLLVAGTAGFFIYRGLLIGYISAHVGTLGVMGLAGITSGAIARKKGYSYWWAFSFGFAFPTLLGLLAVLVFYFLRGVVYCGGSVSLAAALVALFCYSVARKRSRDHNFPASSHRE